MKRGTLLRSRSNVRDVEETSSMKVIATDLTCLSCSGILVDPVINIPCGHTCCLVCSRESEVCIRCSRYVDSTLPNIALSQLLAKQVVTARSPLCGDDTDELLSISQVLQFFLPNYNLSAVADS